MRREDGRAERENQYMQEPDWEKATEKEIWEFVAVHLQKNGINTVLVGGAVVAIYTSGLYQSGDLDFVKSRFDQVDRILKEIGFAREARHFAHPRCKHIIIEFVDDPVAIGEDYKIVPASRKIENTTIKILSPTDCIKDRLSSFIYWQSRDALDQAILVARHNKHDIAAIERWCRKEGKEALVAFEEFHRLLESE